MITFYMLPVTLLLTYHTCNKNSFTFEFWRLYHDVLNKNKNKSMPEKHGKSKKSRNYYLICDF